jgi:hypothetical protein
VHRCQDVESVVEVSSLKTSFGLFFDNTDLSLGYTVCARLSRFVERECNVIVAAMLAHSLGFEIGCTITE